MATTYLTLVNHVLRRLREETVSSVSETEYSAMIGDLVNDAKTQVEDSWKWSALQGTVTFNTVASTATYALTGTENRAIIEDVVNTTSAARLRQMSRSDYRTNSISTPGEGAPGYWVNNGVDANGDAQVALYPTPDAVYAMKFYVVQREAELSADSDTTVLPWQPIMHLALAMAAREKGETGGTAAAELASIAQRALSDAIAYDASRDEDELTWTT